MKSNFRWGTLYFYCRAVSLEVRHMISNVKRIVLTGSLFTMQLLPQPGGGGFQ